MKAVNLLPRDEPKRARRKITTGKQLMLVSPFVIGAILAASYLMASSKVNDHKATLQALQHELASIPPMLEEPQTNAQLALQREQRIQALGGALQSRVAWDRILREISSVLPEDVWLTSLAATSPAAPAPPPPPVAPSTDTTSTETTSTDTTSTDTTSTDTTATPTTTTPAPPPTAPISIAGYTYSQEGVARFMGRLAVIPELQDVKLVTSSEAVVAGRTVVSFSITAGVRSPAASS